MPSRAARSGERPSRRPSKVIAPRVATVPEIARSVVVFPAPFGPRTATISPSSTVSEIPCRAWTGP
jgi:hypothetical protein